MKQQNKRQNSILFKCKKRLQSDLLNKHGTNLIDIIDDCIAKHADNLLIQEPYISVLEKLSDEIERASLELDNINRPQDRNKSILNVKK